MGDLTRLTHLQEALLTLKGQLGRCSNIKGKSQIYGSFPTQGHAHFSLGCGIMVGVGKPKPYTKFEVPSFSRCVDIEVEPQNLGAFLV